MTFTDMMNKMLREKEGWLPSISKNGTGVANLNDYDNIRKKQSGAYDFHGGIDFKYVGASDEFNGSGSVYTPVTGRVIKAVTLVSDANYGSVSILGDNDGYVHTVRHMKNLKVQNGSRVGDSEQNAQIGTMWSSIPPLEICTTMPMAVVPLQR